MSSRVDSETRRSFINLARNMRWAGDGLNLARICCGIRNSKCLMDFIVEHRERAQRHGICNRRIRSTSMHIIIIIGHITALILLNRRRFKSRHLFVLIFCALSHIFTLPSLLQYHNRQQQSKKYENRNNEVKRKYGNVECGRCKPMKITEERKKQFAPDI